jgi:predicted RNase H-like HicB family nuclease
MQKAKLPERQFCFCDMMSLIKREKTIKSEVSEYMCRFTPVSEGGYSVRCSAFPGLITNGKTLEEARQNAREALELCLEIYREKGWKLPPVSAAPKRAVQELISTAFRLHA